MLMSAYRCIGVYSTVGGTGNTKTRQRRGNYGLTDPDLGPMAGEISPNTMFCQTKTNCTETDPDGCAGVRRGAIGCMNKGVTRNKTCITTAKKSASAGMAAVG